MVKFVFYLLSLPARVLCDILGERLYMQSLVRLDSAICHRHSRDIWKLFLSSNQFKLKATEVVNSNNMRFLSENLVKVLKLVFAGPMEANDNSTREYLIHYGSFIQTVVFFGVGCNDYIALVAEHCIELRAVHVLHTSPEHLPRKFGKIMWNNRNLKVLEFRDSMCVTTQFYPYAATVPYTNDYKYMHTFMMQGKFYNIINVLQMLTQAKNLRNLSIEGCDTLIDFDVCSLLAKLPLLRAINIQHSDYLTDHCLQYLAVQAGDRLEIACVDIKNTTPSQTESFLKQLCDKCVNLKYMSVNCGDRSFCAGREASIIVFTCPQLKTLVCGQLGKSSCEFIKALRPDLHLLTSDERDIGAIFDAKL